MIARPKVEAVTFFKNGLCVVKCSFSADQAGDFLWEEPPSVVHGTFLVESGAAVALRSTLRKVVDAESSLPSGNLQTELASADVRITMMQDGERGGR